MGSEPAFSRYCRPLTAAGRHRRYSGDGTWDRILAGRLTEGDARGEMDWSISVDSTVNRGDQHGINLNLPPTTQGARRIT